MKKIFAAAMTGAMVASLAAGTTALADEGGYSGDQNKSIRFRSQHVMRPEAN